MIIFFLLLCTFFALIAKKLFGDVTLDDCDNPKLDDAGEVIEADDYGENFKEFFPAYNIFYALISFDGYPDCMLPAIQSSNMALPYFLLYLSLFLLIFTPIPVAVVFESFRGHRSKLVILDRIK